MIDRLGVDKLIPEPIANEIIKEIAESSDVLRLSKRLPNMSSSTLTLPVTSSLASAGFVDGDTGLKSTTGSTWTNEKIYAEEIAVIVPIPDAVIQDANYDIANEVKGSVAEAMGKVIDRAILFGEGKPNSWANGLIPTAIAKGNVIVRGTNPTAYDDILGESGLLSLLEQYGYTPSAYLGKMTTKSYLRSILDTTGQPIFRHEANSTGGMYTIDGTPVVFPRNGAFDLSAVPKEPLLLAGDFSNLLYSIRQDLQLTISNQAVIQDGNGNILYNLYQQDMTALRFTLRLGWVLPNPPARMNENEADRYRFAVLQDV